MEDENEQQILVTSPKKKVHKLDGKLVRQFSGDMNALLTDDEEEEYVEEVVEEDTENDSVEEIISSSEEEDEDEDDEDDEDSEDDDDDDSEDVELESIDDEDESGAIEDGTDGSGSDFDPLPPPIQIPDALKPPHLRAKQKPQNFYDDYDEDDLDDVSSDSDDSSSDGGGFAAKKKEPATAKKPAATAPKKSAFSYDDDDADLSSSSDDSDSPKKKAAAADKAAAAEKAADAEKAAAEKAAAERAAEKAAAERAAAAEKAAAERAAAEKAAAEEAAAEKAAAEKAAAEKAKKEAEEKKKKQEEEAAAAVAMEAASTQVLNEPTTAMRPASVRGYSLESLPGDDEADKRGGKKPSKCRQEPSSVYEQGQSDLRGASAVKNEPIKQAEETPTPEKEGFKVERKAILPTKKEEEVKDDWNTEPKDDGNGPYYSYDELKGKKIPDLDYLNREKYLSPYDFMNIFEVKKSEFETWPKWKQTKAKRKVKLF